MTFGIAAAGHAVLVVPQPDERAGAVAVHADRMRVHRAVDALAPSCADSTEAQDLVAGSARAAISSIAMSCIAFAFASAFFRPAGASVSPGSSTYALCCVSVFSRATVMPTSQCSTSPRLDDRIRAELLGGRALPLDLDARLEPGAQSLIVRALAPPPHQIARARRARHDHLAPRTSSASSARPARSSSRRTLPPPAAATR